MYGLAYLSHMEKTAFANKVQKLWEAGKLSAKSAKPLFETKPIENTLHNRINARARRGLFGQLPTGGMTADKYKAISKPDNLPNRAAIDTKRIMKHQGHENSKIVSELNRQAERGASVSRVSDSPFNGGSTVGWYSTGQPSRWDIEIPKADATYVPHTYGSAPDARTAKELRALTARHEIAGEATSQSRMLRALDQKGYNKNNAAMNIFRINTHNNPDVLVGDAAMIKRLSPDSQRFADIKNQHNTTGLRNPYVNSGERMDEGQVMNVIRKPNASVTPMEGKDATNIPYFLKPLPTRDEMIESMTNMGTFNLGLNRDIISDLAREYMNTPFYRQNK